MFGLPVVTVVNPGTSTTPTTGEVVGTDPWDDDADGTYARGSVETSTGFHHIIADIDPTVIAAGSTFVFRVSSQVLTFGTPNFVATLYPPSAYADPSLYLYFDLYFDAGPNPGYVDAPALDEVGTPQDITATLRDYYTDDPATPEQVSDFFAAGGTLVIQPHSTGGGACVITIHRITVIGATAPEEPVVIRRIFPRDDALAAGAGRNYPPSRARQSSNRTSGYL